MWIVICKTWFTVLESGDVSMRTLIIGKQDACKVIVVHFVVESFSH